MKLQTGFFVFAFFIVAQSEVSLRVPNTVRWLERLSVCTSNGTFAFNLTINREVLKECTLKFASLYKNGTVLSHTFTVFDLNRADNRHFLYKKSELRLERLKLKAIAAFAINIPELEGLNLRDNELNESTVDVNALELVRNLRFLDLSQNKFETIPDKLIRNLFVLEHLNMSFNWLKTFQFGFGFNQHFKFTILDLSNNKLVSQIASADFNLLRGNKIDVLNVSNCSLSRVNSGVFAKFYHLRVFSMENNFNLNYENFRHLLHAWSQKMEYLNFNNLNLVFNSRFSSMDLVLGRFERTLKYLHMAGNDVVLSDNKDFFEQKLRNYKQLEVLNLNTNRRLFSATNGALNLSSNDNLKELHLSNVDLSSFSRVVLNRNIQQLDLSLNQLDSLGNNFMLNEYPLLDKLNLSSNHFQNISSIIQCEQNSTLSLLDLSNNPNLVLDSEDIRCLFKNATIKVNLKNIKGIKCDSALVNAMRQLSIYQLSSLRRVQCTVVVGIKFCFRDKNKLKTSIKAGDFGKDC